jgi:hypothetical protein
MPVMLKVIPYRRVALMMERFGFRPIDEVLSDT